MNNSALYIDKVTVAYGNKPAIQDVSLSVLPGETFGLMGLNGAGKTSLIKCILGLRTQDSGNISIYGSPCSEKKSKEMVAFLPEKFEPPWFLTGFEFMKFSLSLYNQPFNRDAIVTAARSLALDEGALKHRVNTYSKGMRQKLGLLGTILTNCKILILDEPMSGLDPLARSLVKKMITESKSRDRTIFLSSHILADMDEICDRVAILHNGSIRYVGTPRALKNETSSENLERAFLDFVEKSKAA